jgi:hypothetical protein
MYERDPVSELFDDGARRLLARAYANPGHWAGTRLAEPSPSQVQWARAHGITDLLGRDRVTGGEARTRWARAFTRSLYYQHKWWSSSGGGWRGSRRTVPRQTGGLVVEVGYQLGTTGRVLASGERVILRPGRAVRVKLVRGGSAKDRAVAGMDDQRKWADQGPRWADPSGRDWA